MKSEKEVKMHKIGMLTITGKMQPDCLNVLENEYEIIHFSSNELTRL